MVQLVDALQIRPYRKGDEEEILRCFNETFARLDPEFVPRTLEDWRWEFERNPAGQRIFLALDSEGHVVAQYAATPERVWLEGREVTFSQIVDSMSHPDYRRALMGEKSLFVRVAEPFFEAFGGSERDVVMYGYPIPAAWRIGRKYLNYEMVRETNILYRRLERSGPDPSMPPGYEVTLESSVDAWADPLWNAMRDGFKCCGFRDARTLKWRYLDKPRVRYEIAVVRRTGETTPRGFLVYRYGNFLKPDTAILCDWFVPVSDLQAGQALLAWYDARARSDGAAYQLGVLPGSNAWFAILQDYGFHVGPTQYFMVSRHFVKRYDPLWLRSNWYYTLGDTDLV